MSNLKKIILIFLLVISSVLLLTTFSSAADDEEKERPLEIEYPEIGRWWPTTIEKAFLPEYVKYIFNFAVAIAGLIAFGALIYGGFRYIISAGAPTALTEAKDQIFAGIIGLVILLSSYLILTTINPQLVMLKLEPPTWPELPTDLPGVYLIDEKGEEKAYTSNVPNLAKDYPAGKKIVKARIVNPPGGKYFYGAIFFPLTDFIGKPEFCRNTIETDWKCDAPAKNDPRTLSMFVFREVEKSDGEVILCAKPEWGKPCKTFSEAMDLQSLKKFGLEKKVWSIKITGNYLLLLEGKVEGQWWNISIEYLERFQGPGNWRDLKDHSINRCGCGFSWRDFWYICLESCATKFAIIPIKE